MALMRRNKSPREIKRRQWLSWLPCLAYDIVYIESMEERERGGKSIWVYLKITYSLLEKRNKLLLESLHAVTIYCAAGA